MNGSQTFRAGGIPVFFMLCYLKGLSASLAM